ncbi:zinc finger, CCHC-type containing protein, partial [Tanacetum coccineum]
NPFSSTTIGDENPIRTLGDYSKPSHEGYRKTIELPVGNNVASNWLERLPAGSITTWEDLTTRFLSQFFLSGRTAKLRNDILMFQQHQGESLSEAWARFKDLLQKVPHHGIDLWLQLSVEKTWATIEELARYEDEGWNDPVAPGEGSLDYENPNIEQLLGVMECKVNTLMKEAISLMGRSESVFGMKSNTVYQLPSEPSRQEEFENLITNFILDQEEKVRQLEEYMCVIGSDFMQLSSDVVEKLKEEIRVKKNKFTKIKKTMSPQSTPQDLPPFEEYTPLVTYPEEVGKTLGTPIEVEPLNETKLEEVGLNFLKFKSFFESLGLVPQSSDTEVVCIKGDDREVMFIELIRKNDDSGKEEPEEEGSTTTKGVIFGRRRAWKFLGSYIVMILGRKFNQLSHVSSPLLSKPGEY